MNRIKKATISLCCALTLTGGALLAVNLPRGGFSAFAEEAKLTDYPAEFVKYASEGFENISDYAVSDNFYAFAEGNVISVIENGKDRIDYKTDSTVTALDCGENAEFFYKNGSGATFALATKQPAAHDFKELDLAGVYAGTFNYYLGNNGVPYVSDKSGDDAPLKLEGFSKIKKYGGSVYGIKNGAFMKFEGLDAAEAGGGISYTDLTAAKNVCFGDTVQSLKTLNADAMHYVALKEGTHAYVTEVDLNLISNNPQDTFLPAAKTYKIGAADGPATGKEAMLLAVSGDTYVIAADGVCYIMNKANAGEPFEKAFSSVAENTVMRVAIDKACVYSSPFTCAGTKLADLTKNASVKVVGKVESLKLYVIEYTAESGETVKGFAPYGYISEHAAPIENDPPATNDPDYNEDSVAKTVVLIIAVIALIMIALGYLTFVATSSKRKDKKKKDAADNGSLNSKNE